jgi:hypothetical protein
MYAYLEARPPHLLAAGVDTVSEALAGLAVLVIVELMAVLVDAEQDTLHTEHRVPLPQVRQVLHKNWPANQRLEMGLMGQLDALLLITECGLTKEFMSWH